ncbi:unnamed protein product, partial [Ixodes hexagonus]
MAAHPDALTLFADQMWLKSQQVLPTAEELVSRLTEKKEQLAQHDSPFDDPCMSCDDTSCWLLDHQGPWNELLNPFGHELRCYAPGRLLLTTLPLSLPVLPANRDLDFLGHVLVVLWLLDNHQCIDRVFINTNGLFDDAANAFYRLVQLGPHVKMVRLVMSLQAEKMEINEELLRLVLANTRSLVSLTLVGPVLSQFAMASLCHVLFLNEKLLHVCMKDVAVSPESAQSILAALNECPNLKTVDVDFSIRNPEVPKALIAMLSQNTSILDLVYEVDNAIGFPFKALSRNSTLRVLRVGRFLCDEDDIASLGYALRRNQHLRVLSIPIFTSKNHAAQWSKFTEGLGENVGLKELDLHRSLIVDNVIGVLTEALCVNKTLRKVDVGTDSLSALAATCITEILITNTVVEELRLGHLKGTMTEFAEFCRLLENPGLSNKVYAQFCPALIPMMLHLAREKHSLPEINISGGEQSPPELATALFFTIRIDIMTLTSLKLNLNTTVTPGSAQYLARLFRNSKVLKNVELNMMVSGPEITLLSNGLQGSTSIYRLRIKSWCFDDQSADAFVKMLKGNHSITHLIILKYGAESVDISLRLREAVEENNTLLTIELFEDDLLRVVNLAVLPLLCRNYYRVTRAVAFFEGTLDDKESAEDFRKLALTEDFLYRVKENAESSEGDIQAAIRMKLEDM